MTEPTLILKPTREKSILRRHPWIFSGAVARVEAAPDSGDTVTVRSAAGDFLAQAAYSPKSQIVGRIWSWAEDEKIAADFFARRIAQSINARAALSESTNALRLVNAESDGLPGLIVDRYANFIVCQFLTAGTERWKNEIAAVLMSQPGVVGVYERSDVEVRGKEGLKSSEGLLRGDAPPESIEVWERSPKSLDFGKSPDSGPNVGRRLTPNLTLGCRSPKSPDFGKSPDPESTTDKWLFSVDIVHGHKTGFYLDQRENRQVVAEYARGQKVLNVFAYTGAFTVAAQWSGAQSVISLDSSGPSLALAQHNLEINHLPIAGLTEADAFKMLREYRDRGETFDLIILDPPKFAHTEAQINKATRAYKDINWLACRLLNPGGQLITFSCSGLISEDLFQKILFGAALDAKRDVQIIRRLGQASDHPVLLSFPEAGYLKGFVCRVA